MITIVLLAGLATIATGGALSGVRRTLTVGLTLGAAGSAAVATAGFWLLATGVRLGAAFTGAPFTGDGSTDATLNGSTLNDATLNGATQLALGADRLTGFFLGTLGVVAAPALLYSVGYLRGHRRGPLIAALTSAFLLVLALVLTARDPLTLLAGWELMTLLPAAVILVARGGDRRARRTVFTYLAVTHLGGVGTWTAVLLAAHHGLMGGTGTVASGTALQVGIALAALAGAGTKAGIMPLHVWLPRAHPIAPAPVSALMSGVMIKIAGYLLVRVLVEWVGVLPVWFGVLVLAAGAGSAVGGVVYAIFQHDLKRLLALHSIENVGIIVLGLGACLVLRSRGADAWAGFALAAALLHTLNHAIFKALLFLGAGAFERAAGSLRLDRLGGLLRRMPWTGAAFGIGAMAIAGLPPLNGFASEWATLQALLRVTADGGPVGGVAGALALAALATTAALALLCFVKVVGLVLLGPARFETAGRPVGEAPRSMAAAMLLLAAGCVGLGVAPGTLFGALTRLAPAGGAGAGHPDAAATHTAATTGRIALHLPGTGGLPTLGLALVLAGLTALLVTLRGRRSAEPAPTWVCGQLVEPPLNWTSAGFSKPLRLALAPALRPRREITVREERGVVQEVTYAGEVPQLIDDTLYRPVARWSAAVAAQAARLQSGSLGRYVAYLIGLVVALLAAARLGWLG